MIGSESEKCYKYTVACTCTVVQNGHLSLVSCNYSDYRSRVATCVALSPDEFEFNALPKNTENESTVLRVWINCVVPFDSHVVATSTNQTTRIFSVIVKVYEKN